jgi:ribosome recycling factor
MQKKKGKQKSQNEGVSDARATSPNSEGTAATDPFDFSSLQVSITEAQERLRSTLRQVAPGRQLQQENVEAVHVKMKGSTESVRLSDIAQVVPKGGRTIAILVGQQEVSNQQLLS